MNYNDLPEHVKRRVEFLLKEAQLKSPRDQVITYVMRVLSNHASVDSDSGSSFIKKSNLLVSENALNELKKADLFEQWVKITINEHQVPLKQIWAWLIEFGETLDAEKVWTHFAKNPMVTILKTEDSILNKIGARSSGNADRYYKANIKIITLEEKPYDIWKKIPKSI